MGLSREAKNRKIPGLKLTQFLKFTNIRYTKILKFSYKLGLMVNVRDLFKTSIEAENQTKLNNQPIKSKSKVMEQHKPKSKVNAK